jgi:hypothetical protein
VQRVQAVAIGVSGIAKASPAVAHMANQTLNDFRQAALAYTFVRKVCAQSCESITNLGSPSKKTSDVGAVEVAYTFVRKVCAHSWDVISRLEPI